MEPATLLEILNRLREETLEEMLSPSEDNKSAYGYGHVSGRLYAVEWFRREVLATMEQIATRQEQFERNF